MSRIPESFDAAAASSALTGEIHQERDLFRLGYMVGIESGRSNPEPDVEQALQELGTAEGQRLASEPFDPSVSAADARTEAEYERRHSERDRARNRCDHARAFEREARLKLGARGAEPELPAMPHAQALLAALAVAFTLVVTFMDLIFLRYFPDQAQAFVLSLGCGLVVGGFVIWTLLSSAVHADADRHHRRWLGIALLFGASLFGMRLTVSHTARELLFGLALMLLEIVVLLVIETFACSLRREWAAHRVDSAAWACAAGALEQAQAILAECQNEVATCDQSLLALEEELRDRDLRARGKTALMAAGASAAIAGYRFGIEVGRGRLSGVLPTSLSAGQALNQSNGRRNGVSERGA